MTYTLSTADHGSQPPRIAIPRRYNAADDLIGRNLGSGRANKIAYIDDLGQYTYGELAQRANRFANVLGALGVVREQRIMMCMLDTIDFPSVFLGAIKAGVVPVATNTLLTQGDYEYMLTDSRSRIAVVSAPLAPLFEPLLGKVATLERIVIAGSDEGDDALATLMGAADDRFETVETTCDDACFWLYSSGSTGAPKGTVHVQSSLIQTAELYGRGVLGIREEDTVFSAAKLFFAYGLGNGLTFPMSVGATTVLMAERPTPDSVFRRLREHRPTIFYGVPTLYAAMLASPDFPSRDEMSLRACTSAGEALPEEIGKRWEERVGVPILDGIGSTEMLHIFISNRPGDVRYGTTGKPVPGYEMRLIDDEGNVIEAADVTGELQISGPTSAMCYWNNRAKTHDTFQGPWTRSGDKYSRTADGYYIYAGRSDDMLKISGIYVSPIEVESCLIQHEAVLEAAVVGIEDENRLIKPKAFVVLKPGVKPTSELGEAIKQHVKSHLAPYKYPRWMEFVDELPKTATGKIQRFKLRALGANR
ncbi:MAG TPA: benzoate-CoA ligase family protein [Rhodocyclaceae bacterium]|nr:benzoate-CoA ligase family protein [Rhodocyclaceae bacterium]